MRRLAQPFRRVRLTSSPLIFLYTANRVIVERCYIWIDSCGHFSFNMMTILDASREVPLSLQVYEPSDVCSICARCWN
jgi:hypothetical protein